MRTLQRYGAIVFFHGKDVVLVKQTIKRSGRYVIDATPVGGQKERYVSPGGDEELSRVVRLASEGKL